MPKASQPLPDWAEKWSRAKCPCGSRTVVVTDYTGQERIVCADSAWDIDVCIEKRKS